MNREKIHRFLSGELSEDITSELLAWINKSEANNKYFARIKNLWTASRLDHPLPELDINKEFELLNYQIARKSKETRLRSINLIKSTWFFYFSRAAAILLLVYSVLLSYYFINERNRVSYNEISTNRGEKASIKLADGTWICLNSDTRLRYPTNLNSKEVKVYLEGEAYFDVEKNPDRTFIVNASSLDIAVLGTSFNVKSYAEDNLIETTLEEGKISITGKMGSTRIKDPVVLKPNQQATFKINSSNYSVSKISEEAIPENKQVSFSMKKNTNEDLIKHEMIIAEQVESKLYTSWKDGKLIFRTEPFEDLALRMERWYDVKIQFTDEELKEQKYTGVFEKETLEQALLALSLSFPFSYEIDRNKVILSLKNNKTHIR